MVPDGRFSLWQPSEPMKPLPGLVGFFFLPLLLLALASASVFSGNAPDYFGSFRSGHLGACGLDLASTGLGWAVINLHLHLHSHSHPSSSSSSSSYPLLLRPSTSLLPPHLFFSFSSTRPLPFSPPLGSSPHLTSSSSLIPFPLQPIHRKILRHDTTRRDTTCYDLIR